MGLVALLSRAAESNAVLRAKRRASILRHVKNGTIERYLDTVEVHAYMRALVWAENAVSRSDKPARSIERHLEWIKRRQASFVKYGQLGASRKHSRPE